MENKILNSATRIVLILITISIIGMNWMSIEIWEPLKTLAVMVFSFYFGKKSVDLSK